ncbi:MAG: alpha/beta hydrolase family protein [Butyricimonas faecalis]
MLRDNKGKVIMELASPDLTRLYETDGRCPEPFTVKAADGHTDLYGFMWKPLISIRRHYPIISYVYPGPQTEAIPLEFSVTAAYNVGLAQVGFVVVTFGHRGGSPMRDKWYHTFGYNNLRDYPLADDKCGIEQLADRFSFIDKSKVGIFGHSGGGFMSTAALYLSRFLHGGCFVGGNHDNNIYNQWWGETHHGVREIKSPRENREDSVTGKDTTISVEKIKFETRIPTNIELKEFERVLMLVTGVWIITCIRRIPCAWLMLC